jgi:hypothetical protein
MAVIDGMFDPQARLLALFGPGADGCARPPTGAAGPAANLRAVGARRLEAFSDGVIAVAITLLVLQIAVPTDLHGHSLAHALLANWSHYAAYIVSFMTIGIIWINHHAMISRLSQVDHTILRVSAVGMVPYVAAAGLAFVSAYVTLGVCAAVGVDYAMPAASRRALAD